MGIHQSIGRAGEPGYLIDMTRMRRMVRKLEAEGRPVCRAIFFACHEATSIYFGCSIDHACEGEITSNGYRVTFILCGYIFAITGFSCSDSKLSELKHGRFLVQYGQRYLAFDIENFGSETRRARTESVDLGDLCAESRGGASIIASPGPSAMAATWGLGVLVFQAPSTNGRDWIDIVRPTTSSITMTDMLALTATSVVGARPRLPVDGGATLVDGGGDAINVGTADPGSYVDLTRQVTDELATADQAGRLVYSSFGVGASPWDGSTIDALGTTSWRTPYASRRPSA